MTFTISDNDNIIDYNTWHFNRFINPCLSSFTTCNQRVISYKYQSPNPSPIPPLYRTHLLNCVCMDNWMFSDQIVIVSWIEDMCLSSQPRIFLTLVTLFLYTVSLPKILYDWPELSPFRNKSESDRFLSICLWAPLTNNSKNTFWLHSTN